MEVFYMNKFKGILLAVVCTLFLTAVFMYHPASAAPTVVSDGKAAALSLISVSGSADVMVVPDEVIITLGIDTRDKDVNAAKTENDKRTKKIIEVAKSFKITSKNIQMDFMDIRPCDITQKSIYPAYTDNIAPENLGYAVKKKIVVTIKDLNIFENFLTEVLKNGVEYVQGVEFKTSELRQNKDKARELAVKAAREKADAMTAALGQKAGKAVNIREEQEYYWSWYDYWYSGFYGNNSNMLANNVQNAVSSSGGMQNTDGVAPGQIKVSAKVSIDFNLE
jgi:uncharacterized protein